MSKANHTKQTALADRLEQAIGACEEKTSVEFVVVFARASGRYNDLDLLAGLLGATIALLVMVFAPFNFVAWALVPNVALVFVLGWLASRRLPLVRRLLGREKRRREQARVGAESALVRQGIYHTRDRTGLLVYVSWFERYLDVVADVGIQAAVPRPEWNNAVARLRTAAFAPDFPETFIAALCELADLLGRYLPPVGDNPNEIPNRPVML